jgi:hypothetical protein
MKKRKKVPINVNKLFTGIKEIKITQKEQQRQIALFKEKDLTAETHKTADAILDISIA